MLIKNKGTFIRDLVFTKRADLEELTVAAAKYTSSKILPFRGGFASRKPGIPANSLGGIHLHLKGRSETAAKTL